MLRFSRNLVAAVPFCACMTFSALGLIPVVEADESGRGLTSDFEIRYLKFIADHHYAALRMTELAAGTDLERTSAISADEGTSPTPNAAAIQGKAQMEALKSMARRNNRMQREEILQAQTFLKGWYGITYQPAIRQVNQQMIALLESTPAGSEFDHIFMEVFSRHHYSALEPSASCQVAAEITHEKLHRYCSNIVHSQIGDIKDMREMLCEQFNICDYQPFNDPKGRHSSE